MKQYILFAWAYYYPNGGLDDVHSSYDTFLDAHAAASQFADNWDSPVDRYMIVDRDTWDVLSIWDRDQARKGEPHPWMPTAS